MNVVIRGDVNTIRIGARTNVQDGTVVHLQAGTHPTAIGEFQVPPRSLVMGSPAKIQRSLVEAEVGLIRRFADNYVAYRVDYA
jgi:carbonic anhydrase/acetyltransferase-like protein (isoleucine patch superfamily)